MRICAFGFELEDARWLYSKVFCAPLNGQAMLAYCASNGKFNINHRFRTLTISSILYLRLGLADLCWIRYFSLRRTRTIWLYGCAYRTATSVSSCTYPTVSKRRQTIARALLNKFWRILIGFSFRSTLKTSWPAYQHRVAGDPSAIPLVMSKLIGEVAGCSLLHRAVGQACGANWFPLVIPCHRVTASGGLGGFAHHE